jgi:glycosyltransferase involved in cell wall biosynthesis
MAPPRHVALNALWLDPGRSGGPETYLRGLVPALADADPRLRLTILTTRRGARALVTEGWRDLATIVALPADEGERARRLAAEQVLLPAAARRRGADLVHSLASTAPLVPRLPAVITLHDATYLHFRTFGLATTVAMAATSALPAHSARVLITGSEAARDDLVATLRLPAAKFVIAPHGAGRLPGVPPTPEAGLRRRLGIPEEARVVLCVAAVRPHKNQRVLVGALEQLADDVVVVLAGAHDPYADEVRAAAPTAGVAARLVMPGYVDDADLEGLWGMASCAAFPTLAEGFGLPLLEALQRGVPVAASGIDVLREVGGRLPHYFDPRDPRQAASAIRRALESPLDRTAAEAWLARYTWPRAAEATLEAYGRCSAL